MLIASLLGCSKKEEAKQDYKFIYDEWDVCAEMENVDVLELKDWDTFEDSERQKLYIYLEIKSIDETRKVKCYYIDEENKQLQVEFE